MILYKQTQPESSSASPLFVAIFTDIFIITTTIVTTTTSDNVFKKKQIGELMSALWYKDSLQHLDLSGEWVMSM